MPVITIGTTGASWGLTAETAIIVQSHSAKSRRDKNEVQNHEGDVALVAYFNPRQEGTLAGVIVGTNGIAAAAPGVELTVANQQNTGGITVGDIMTDEVDVTQTNTDFKRISVTYTRYPLIT